MNHATHAARGILGEPKVTDKGLIKISFADYYGDPCHIAESSLIEEEVIWIGVADAPKKMLLAREDVAALLPVLQRFVDTGEIAARGQVSFDEIAT
jgi:hypothetical protein